ncbi:YHS domain-containing (seleno)protein [uncultured Algibacter sp.]|uniref:YHS domain-containing (seleno)protein n=1 Tax=uncultured Algibacter sp. TaxID=298659 RepID=UPI003216ABBE
MKHVIYFFFLGISISFSQNIDYNLKKGFVAEGYDVVAYFKGEAVEGYKEFVTTHDGVKYKFSSQENLDLFNNTPEKYTPQYGGYCAYAIAAKGKKVGVNPETFLIKDDKLYLFYNAWGTNTLELWNKENPDKLKNTADAEWLNVKFKK